MNNETGGWKGEDIRATDCAILRKVPSKDVSQRLEVYLATQEEEEMNGNREIHILSAFCHGMMSNLHILGFLYNLRKKNWGDCAIHAVALIYSAKSVHGHIKDAKEARRE